MGQFYYAAKAFDILDRLDSDKEYEEALRGSVIGILGSFNNRCFLNGNRLKRNN